MAHTLEVITNLEELHKLTTPEAINEKNRLLLVNLGGGALKFGLGTFNGASADDIYAQKFDREPVGTGPHFDIHNHLVSSDYPYLSVFNLSGSNALRAVALPEDLAKHYEHAFSEATDEAFQARRHLGAISMSSPLADIGEGELNTGMGIILPQTDKSPTVHEVIPKDSKKPGAFVKFTVPADKKAIKVVEELGYIKLDELLTIGIGGNPESKDQDDITDREPLDLMSGEHRDIEPLRSRVVPRRRYGSGGGRLLD